MIEGVDNTGTTKENRMKITSKDHSVELDDRGLLDVSEDARDAEWPVTVMVTLGVHIALTGEGTELDDRPSRVAMETMMRAAITAVEEDAPGTAIPFTVDGRDGAPLALVVLKAKSDDIDPLFVVGFPSLVSSTQDEALGRYVDCPACGAITLHMTEDGADEPCDACGGVETWEH